MNRIETSRRVRLGAAFVLAGAVGAGAGYAINELNRTPAQINGIKLLDCAGKVGRKTGTSTQELPSGAQLTIGGENGGIVGFFTEQRLEITSDAQGNFTAEGPGGSNTIKQDGSVKSGNVTITSEHGVIFDTGNIEYKIKPQATEDKKATNLTIDASCTK